MWRYPVLLAFGGFLIFGCCVAVFGFFSRRRVTNRYTTMKIAVESERQKRDNVWKEVDSIKDMVALYMNMVAKHGPKSEEAQAFRFGTNSSLMKKLHDNESMEAFEQQANIIDETYWKCRKRK